MIKIAYWFRDFLDKLVKKEPSAIEESAYLSEEKAQAIRLNLYASFCVANKIASSVAQTRWITYQAGQEVKKNEYYLLNIQANRNQNAIEFWEELVTKLLYYGEVLIVSLNSQLIIADNGFIREKNIFTDDIFSSVSYNGNVLSRDFKSSEVLYLSKSFSADMRSILAELTTSYAELINEAGNKFVNNDGTKGVVLVDSTNSGSKDFEEKFRKLMTNDFKNFFNSKNAVLPLGRGFKFERVPSEDKKTTSEVSDRELLFTSSLKRVAQAYGMPAGLITGDNDSVLPEIYDVYISSCVDPVVNLIATELNAKRYGMHEFNNGNYIMPKINCKTRDIVSYADAISKLATSDIFETSEIRSMFNYANKKKGESTNNGNAKNAI